MATLSINKEIAVKHALDIRIVLGDQPVPPQDTKDMFKLVYTGDDPMRRDAFARLQRLPGVIVEY